MVFVTGWIIRWSFEVRERIGYSLVFFVLIMMAGMLGGAVIYFSSPGLPSLEEAALLNFISMPFGIMIVLYAFISNTGMKGKSPLKLIELKIERKTVFILSAVTFILFNEILMGWAFSLISGLLKPTALTALPSLISALLNSYWFTLTMGSEMLLSVYLFRKRLPKDVSILLAFQAGLMLLAPTGLAEIGLRAFAVYAGSFLMTGMIIYIFDILYRNRNIDRTLSDYIFSLLALYSFMMAALFEWALGLTGLFYGLTLAAEMILFFLGLKGVRMNSGKRRIWTRQPAWTFGLLGFLFIAEYFMGGLMDIQYYGSAFIRTAGTISISGILPVALGKAFFDFIQYVGMITGSSWFLVMMGVEMGALVLFQITKVRELETKIRLGMVMVAYSIYTVFLPTFFYSTSALPRIPFVGYTMGIGSSGPVAPVFLLAIVVTYLISGVLSLLFGGRQVCSLFCSAALMYQGTFYDAMKSFNRKTRLSAKTVKNRITLLYGSVASIVWVSIFAAAVISYLNSTGMLHLTFFGEDTAEFAYNFYFNFLWYAVFISIPFIGTYGCLNTGMCHWGMFNQFMGRLGFWKLKVREPYQCVECKTKDCASACPVGLTAMPGAFIERGEFKNYKCIGVGDCVSACPVSNIQFYDVRHWLAEKLKRGHAESAINVVSAVSEKELKGIEGEK